MPDDRGLSPALFQHLTLAILDHSAEEGLRMIATVRSYLDAWETFLQDRHELVDHLRAAHHAGPACNEADPASLNRQHWHAHGSDLTGFLNAHPVQQATRCSVLASSPLAAPSAIPGGSTTTGSTQQGVSGLEEADA